MGMKRANGAGTVYKRKDKKLRRPYQAVITLGWTDEGKRLRKSLGAFEKAADAWDALAKYRFNPDEFINKDVLFSEAWEWMIEEKRRQGVDIAKGKFAASKAKLKPLWNMPMQSIRVSHIQSILDKYKNLSRSSHENILKAVSGVFKEAIKNDVISKNYALMVTLPPIEKSTMHVPFSESEIEKLWSNRHDRLTKILLIYIYTGIRPIELYTIKLSDVHLKERYMRGGVKTKAGKDRIIPIAECILPFISEIYALASFKKSETFLPPKYIPVRPWPNIIKLCKELKISNHKPHDTRHTFITLARNYGMDVFILKTIVGHSHAGDVTSDVYTHKNTGQLIDAVDKLPVNFAHTGVATV